MNEFEKKGFQEKKIKEKKSLKSFYGIAFDGNFPMTHSYPLLVYDVDYTYVVKSIDSHDSIRRAPLLLLEGSLLSLRLLLAMICILEMLLIQLQIQQQQGQEHIVFSSSES